MESFRKKFRVKDKFKLSDHDPGYSSDLDKSDAETVLNELKAALGEHQETLYASGACAVLIVFQAMDAAGKDSVIKHVMSGLNPQGCSVTSFKQPSPEEAAHDFLWRHAKALPAKGMIGIHNRSHYENVLVLRVHPDLLGDGVEATDHLWDSRYESIRDFEKHLVRNGTVVMKFFLNVSADEQRKRFLERLDDPGKNWKFAAGDLDERDRWDDYQAAYEKAMRETSTDEAPWYVIPADKKWFTRIAVARIITDTLKAACDGQPGRDTLKPKDIEAYRKRLG